MHVSLSQIQCFRQCQQLYYYRYVAKLRKREAVVPLERGKLLHEYLEHYYLGLQNGFSADDAYENALEQVLSVWEPECIGMGNIAFQMGSMDTAEELFALPKAARFIIERYHVVRGRGDADRYQIIAVERRLEARIARGLTSTGVADLVTRDLWNDQVQLWEHKSTKQVPSTGYRLRDLQTLLYAAKLAAIHHITIDSVHWNYLRTELPKEPKITPKGGTLERRKNIDSTWHVYQRALLANGEAPDDYPEMQLALGDRELTAYYPRFEHVLVARGDVLLRDYVQTAKALRTARRDWERGKAEPIRTLTKECDWCSHVPLCSAVIMGGNVEELIELRYTRDDDLAEEAIPILDPQMLVSVWAIEEHADSNPGGA